LISKLSWTLTETKYTHAHVLHVINKPLHVSLAAIFGEHCIPQQINILIKTLPLPSPLVFFITMHQ